MPDPTYDFVIVGGGSAGCALANRLSADPGNSVLLLEAGKSDPAWDLITHIPAAMGMAAQSPRHAWQYVSDPEPNMYGRRMVHPRGHMLGGSGSVNVMNYMRGNPANFERWARSGPGMESWDFAHVLPYFKRVETSLEFGNDTFRGNAGPHVLSRASVANPLYDVFFAAARQAGYELVPDFNGARQEGFSVFERIIKDGRRFSASQAYLRPARSRQNLTVRTHAHATQVVFAGNRATGIVYRDHQKGEERHVRGREIVLCGGSFNTPQLLQLSGVGDTAELAGLGIAPVHHLPGVGKHLEDHLAVQVQHACTEPISVIGMKDKKNWPKMGIDWLRHQGDGTSNLFEAAGLVRSHAAAEFPDVLLVFAPVAMAFDPDNIVDGHGYQLHVSPMDATSRGHVSLRSADPMAPPRIVMNYLDTAKDREDWVTALRLGRALLRQPAFRPYDGGEVVPGPSADSDAALLEWVARKGQTGLHPTGTCRMGVGEEEVVDPASMRVHGLEGVRVVDASVFPTITNAQTYAPTMMVAEKAADLILGNTPLPAEHLDWHTGREQGAGQHQPSTERPAAV